MALPRRLKREKAIRAHLEFRKQMRLVLLLVVLTTGSCIAVAYSATTLLASSVADTSRTGSLRLYRQNPLTANADRIIAEDSSSLSLQINKSAGDMSTDVVDASKSKLEPDPDIEEHFEEKGFPTTQPTATLETTDASDTLATPNSTALNPHVVDADLTENGPAQSFTLQTLGTKMPLTTPASTTTILPIVAEVKKAEAIAPVSLASEGCFSSADYGVIDELRSSFETFCSPPNAENSASAFQSSYTAYRSARANIVAAVFQGLRIDMSKAEVAHDITTLAEDGGQHDPRYRVGGVRRLCKCEGATARQNWALEDTQVWRSHLADDKQWSTSSYRLPSESARAFHACGEPGEFDTPTYSVNNSVHVLMVTRKDDHNPFFQISQTFNTWVMMKALDWSNLDAQIVYLDKGIPSPVDQLRWKMLAPQLEPLYVHDLSHHPDTNPGIIEFGTALLSPFEAIGPMMRHLDDYEPCGRSQLLQDFRSTALATMGVHDYKETANCVMTVISRRNYGGRKIQRVWINEDEALKRMQADFGDKCNIQSVDFVNLTMTEQMQTIVDSDIVIGMHGAGMVNVLWSRPGTLVVEIFPKRRFRWGFRNICQRVGCDWHEFRGGRDTMSRKPGASYGWGDPNAMDKEVPPDEWAAFANPLIENAINAAHQRSAK